MSDHQNCFNMLILVHHFPPTFKGGAEWRAHRTAQWLQKRGHTVKLICVDAVNDTETESLRYVDDEFDGLSVRRLFLNLSNAPNQIQWEYDNPWIGEHLEQYMADFKPDLVHLISGYLMTASAIKTIKKYQIPLVATLTDFWFLCPRHTLQRTSGDVCPENSSVDCVRCQVEMQRRFRLPAQKFPTVTNFFWDKAKWVPDIASKVEQIDQRQVVLKDAFQMIDFAICPSNFLKGMYQQKGFAAKNMVFMRQGLKHLPEHPPQKKAANRLRVGYIGGIAQHKGVACLVDGFLKIKSPDIELKLYGDTAKFPAFYAKLLAKAEGDERIQFMGTFNNQQIGAIHAELDVLVVPSTWYENSPNVILEAFAYRTPIITANLGGMAELVDDQRTGLLFEPDDADDLAAKFQFLIDEPHNLKIWQQNIETPKDLETEMIGLAQAYETAMHLISDAPIIAA